MWVLASKHWSSDRAVSALDLGQSRNMCVGKYTLYKYKYMCKWGTYPEPELTESKGVMLWIGEVI